uniref:Zinc finger protein 800 n=1 Tax=Poecilia formosa TaxID=48698 RepID=A0A096M6R5_POEFO
MEELNVDTQHPPQDQSKGGDQILIQNSPPAGSLSENCEHKEAPVEAQEKSDTSAQPQAKSLWKPIPPLVPELHRSTETRDQSCQTEEQGQPPAANNDGHNAGLCAEPGDPPLLQQPLQTSKSGIQQIIECFRSGTNQLRTMLLREVDTIFECKLCRSLFRGLPNLITHKEYYCLSRLPESDGSSGDDRQSVAMKDLLDAIYPRADRPDYVVRLEPIQTTNKAVFQYLTTEEELARFPSHTTSDSSHSFVFVAHHSARESPVAWEGETMEGVENNPDSQPNAPESHVSPVPKTWEADDEAKEEQPKPEDEGSNSGVEDVTISCCLCGQDFNSRRSIRRHCRKMHQTKLEELRKFTETRTVPTSLLSMVKGRKLYNMPTGKSCPVCLKTFATKANVRRHFDEVHRGLRRDTITPNIASRPGQPFTLDSKTTPVNSKTSASNQAQGKPQSKQTNSASCRCTLCKRNYSSQLMLKRHMRIVHKIYSVRSNKSGGTPSPAASASSANVSLSNNVRVKEEAMEPSDEDDDDSSLGFDFKQLFCKLCKRQFSSRQNLTKHIELHTDGNDIFIKFYRCPLCRYESRRKRDVLRHVTVVHKKSSQYLAKIMPKLESRAVKRLAEAVLNSTKRTGGSAKEEMNGRHISASAPPAAPITRKQQELSSPVPTPSPPVTRKQERQQTAHQSRPVSPPLTRRSEKHSLSRSASSSTPSSNQTPHTRRHDAQSESSPVTSSTEVKVTKNFSLHACDQCGRAFAKKLYLESHKRSHRNATVGAASRRKGVSTRSKSLVW